MKSIDLQKVLIKHLNIKENDRIRINYSETTSTIYTLRYNEKTDEYYLFNKNAQTTAGFYLILIYNFDVIKTDTRIGDIKCKCIKCDNCPLNPFTCGLNTDNTLFEIFNKLVQDYPNSQKVFEEVYRQLSLPLGEENGS